MDPSKFIDYYTMRARVIPGLLAVLPLAVTVYAWEAGNPFGWNSLGGIVVGFGGTILLAFIARDLGKAAEDRLFKKWGGRPTELLMMHSGPDDPALLARRHAALRMLFPDVPVPTAEDEVENREAACRRFSVLTKLIITRCRASKDYPLVFEENCNYGFRRNMYGLRPIGVAVSAITSIALGLALLIAFSSHRHVAVMSLAIEGVDVIMLLIWVFWVSESAVRKGAHLYAERLFETIDGAL